MESFELFKLLFFFLLFYISLWITMSISLYITLKLAKKWKSLKHKKVTFKTPMNIAFQALGLHYISSLIFFTIVNLGVSNAIKVSTIIFHMIITIFLYFYFPWLIKKAYQIKFIKGFIIYFCSGFFVAIIYYGGLFVIELIKRLF